ncbi:MAG TPA: hypothetical protein VFU69_19660 [Ktedonobacterales bacterium]|nr:hypothetical protein [Ktedonobacterales bacterium]
MRTTSRTHAPTPPARSRRFPQAHPRARLQKLAYPWLWLRLTRAERAAGLSGLVIGIALAYLYSQYLQGADAAPDSVYGLSFAVGGTLLLILVGAGYTLRKRWHPGWPGRLHTFLAWHMVGGLLGLLLLWMHAMGSFDQPSGAYAFYGVLGIVASGIAGRVIDYICPRLAARAALGALNANGEDRLEDLAAAAVTSPRRRLPALRREARAVQHALRREQHWLLLIRLWRAAHILICLVAASFIVWHLIFALNWLLNGY